MSQLRSDKGRLRRKAGNKKRTTVRAVYRAIRNYPTNTGASVRDIHRIITKNEKGRSRRSLSSVKLAISRAVQSGSIRAPKGWSGFRGINSPNRQNNARGGRRGPGRPGKSRNGRRRSSTHRRRTNKGQRKGGYRGYGGGRLRRARINNKNNSSPTNMSDNYNMERTDEESSSLWQSYTCVIS